MDIKKLEHDLAQEIRDEIITRTRDGLDYLRHPFADYSDSYAEKKEQAYLI